MKNRYTQLRVSILFIFLTLLFCWLFCGKYGVFGSKVDWISQHSVFPDYFRQQFYDTGDFFPEFALDIGGGQNIYHFAYYGLYSPVFWLSYLLPFVKMGDYLIAASFVCLTASIILFYCWLKKRGFSPIICFLTACLFLLAAPMIFQSYNQIMFVNYMPFLCMGLWGVDSFLEKGSSFLYILSVFFMILTSFYFSVGGILVLILYGMHRYFLLQDLSEEDLRLWRFFRDGIRFFVPHTACNSAECLLFDADCNGFDRRKRRKQRYNAFVSFGSFYQTFCGFVSPVWHWSDHTGCDSFACRNYMETKRRADSCMGVDFHFDDTFIFVSPQWWIIHPG